MHFAWTGSGVLAVHFAVCTTTLEIKKRAVTWHSEVCSAALHLRMRDWALCMVLPHRSEVRGRRHTARSVPRYCRMEWPRTSPHFDGVHHSIQHWNAMRSSPVCSPASLKQTRKMALSGCDRFARNSKYQRYILGV